MIVGFKSHRPHQSPKERTLRLAQSFNKKEVEAICTVLLMLGRKGDPSILLKRPEMLSVSRKFLGMKKRMDEVE